MNDETRTVTNLSGTSITVVFDRANTIEDDEHIWLRIPSTRTNPHRGQTSTNLLLIAFKRTYPTRELFLQQVENAGKEYVLSWLASNHDVMVMPLPDLANLWTLNIEGEDNGDE
jgi:hypothetical protein